MQPVYGLTVLYDQLYIVRKEIPQVDVYDVNTFELTRHLAVYELIGPRDMTSCRKYECLYIVDCRLGGTIHRVQLNGQNHQTTRWEMKGEEPAGISITSGASNVLVTCGGLRKLIEYTSHGVVVREIRLDGSIPHPFHASQLYGDIFVVHGEMFDELNRLCIVANDGSVKASYGGAPGNTKGQLQRPRHLAIDMQGNILIADCLNARVLILKSSLVDGRELLTKREDGKRFDPRRLCFDESRTQLYIADYTNKDVLVFSYNVDI